MMLFIDGENLTFRYEEMLKAGCVPLNATKHQPGVYAWDQSVPIPMFHVVLRATYYTYAQGDETSVAGVCDRIRSLRFEQYAGCGLEDTLTPRVFKKPKGRKAKGVDIQMCLDILSNVYQDNTDAVYLLSGDGDYFPVLEECQRRGKSVYVGAFSDGYNKQLTDHSDKYYCLNRYFFSKYDV